MHLFPILLAFSVGCPHKWVIRNPDTLTVETLAALKRQEDAALLLLSAAKNARETGDVALCVKYATSALLIYSAAKPQAYRALWLAGLPYPLADGTMPPEGTEQEDPGPSTPPGALSDVCGELQ